MYYGVAWDSRAVWIFALLRSRWNGGRVGGGKKGKERDRDKRN